MGAPQRSRAPIKPFSISSRMRRGRPRRCGSGCARWCRSGRGVLILDGTSFPETRHGVGRRRPAVLRRARQDRELPDGGHGRVVDGRAGVAAGRDAVSARGVADARVSGRGPAFPPTVAFAPKWQLALTLLRQVRAAGFTVTAVVGDAEFGDNATLRRTLHRAKLPYALGVSSDLKVFLGTPAPRGARRRRPGKGRPRTRRLLPPDTHTIEARAWAATQTAAPVATRLVAQRHATRVARPLLCRPGHARPRLARRPTTRARSLVAVRAGTGGGDRARYYLVDLPRHRLAARPRADSPISAGPSSSSIKNSRTNSASITSKAAVCRAGNAMSS